MNGTLSIFSFFFKKGLKSKKIRLFIFLSFFPVILLGSMKCVDVFNPGFLKDLRYLLGEMITRIYFLLVVQLLALFFGSSVINEEIEEQTIVYLTTRPISKKSILLGKFVAYSTLPSTLVILGMMISFIIYFSLFNFDVSASILIQFILALSGLVILHIIAYNSLCVFLGTFLKRPIFVGLIFIFGWENVVHYLPGFTRILTFSYYLRPMLPSFNYSFKSSLLRSGPPPPSTPVSILMLLFLSIVFLILSIVIFQKREYIISDYS